MSKKSNKKTALLIGLGAAAVYGILKNSGIINKTIYKKEHEAVSRYIESHYPGGFYSDIKRTEQGFITIITTPQFKKIALFFTETENGNFIFSETSAEK